MVLKKKVLISKCNKGKSEQYVVATSAKGVMVFQASLKLVREEAGTKLTKLIHILHPKDQNVYMKEDIANENGILI